MARQKNDGRGRLGGRAKGTPNKATATLKEWVGLIIDQNREKFNTELNKLNSSDYVKAFLTLLGYSIPKQQAVNIQTQIEAEYNALKELLESCPDELIERLTEKLTALSNNINKSDEL
ncbi:MAG: hypothetical protein NC339_04020 [Muribaculaceae bacterium]|nr:hypothetical protein [Muribaculaceae bacterium]